MVPTHKPPAATVRKQVSIRESRQQETKVVRSLKPSMAESMASAPRQSSRSATLKNRQQVEEQLKEYEHRRVSSVCNARYKQNLNAISIDTNF